MSTPASFALFDSALGECGLAWTGAGVCAVWLPETRAGGLRARIARRLPQARETAAAGELVSALAALRALLLGQPADLRGVPIDLSRVSPFQRRVYAATRAIPAGRVLTYAVLAEQVGAPAVARAVGQALGANPLPLIVPCHRVIAAHGRLGGFSAPGGTALKRRLLMLENARLDEAPGLFDAGVRTLPSALP